MSIGDWYADHSYAEDSDPTYDRANDDSRDPFEFGAVPAEREHAPWGTPARRATSVYKPSTAASRGQTSTGTAAHGTRPQAAANNPTVTQRGRTASTHRDVVSAVVLWLQQSPQGATADCLASLQRQGLIASADLIKSERKKLLAMQLRAQNIRPKLSVRRPPLKRQPQPTKSKPLKAVQSAPGKAVSPLRPRSGPKDADRCPACDLVPTWEGHCRCG